MDAVREGRLTEERLAEAASRVLALSRWYAASGAAEARTARNTARAWGGHDPGDEDLGLRTARAAMRVVGTPPVLSGPPLVVDIALG